MSKDEHGQQHGGQEPIHDQGQGHSQRGSGHAGSNADEIQGGGGRDHVASGSHTHNGTGSGSAQQREELREAMNQGDD